MTRGELRLEPAKRRFQDMTRGKYQATVARFMDNGEAEQNVRYDNDLQSAYMGLRRAISTMGLKGQIAARRHRRELHLIRLGW